MLISEVSATYNQNQRRDNKDVVFKSVYQWNDIAVEQLKQQFHILQGNWKSISQQLNGPSPLECMIKWQSLNPKQTLSRQLWSEEEDEQLKELVKMYGKKWSKICTVMNWRTGKQVRERYLNQLQMHINYEKWTDQEDKMILKLYKKFGTKWSYISSLLNGRPENMVKNRFYATLRRRFQKELDFEDQSQDSEDSQESYNINKYKKKKKQRPYKLINDSIQIKKCQLQDVSPSIFQRITRSNNNIKSNKKMLKYRLNNRIQLKITRKLKNRNMKVNQINYNNNKKQQMIKSQLIIIRFHKIQLCYLHLYKIFKSHMDIITYNNKQVNNNISNIVGLRILQIKINSILIKIIIINNLFNLIFIRKLIIIIYKKGINNYSNIPIKYSSDIQQLDQMNQ